MSVIINNEETTIETGYITTDVTRGILQKKIDKAPRYIAQQ